MLNCDIYTHKHETSIEQSWFIECHTDVSGTGSTGVSGVLADLRNCHIRCESWKRELGGGALANSVITAKFSSSSLGKVISLDKNGESIISYTSRAAARAYVGEE